MAEKPPTHWHFWFFPFLGVLTGMGSWFALYRLNIALLSQKAEELFGNSLAFYDPDKQLEVMAQLAPTQTLLTYAIWIIPPLLAILLVIGGYRFARHLHPLSNDGILSHDEVMETIRQMAASPDPPEAHS